ncbi:MAG: T9SS C-terminal target domain-containing protein [Ignavibacteria bacterium]|nr:MAG: T9SS C-terminal target domain-containing protein [Ignavibacteria bacterium]
MKRSVSMSLKLGSFLFMLIPLIINAQWKNIGPGGGSDLQTILIQPDNPDIVYCGGDIEGMFKTTDGGKTWKSINNNIATGPWTPDVYWTNQMSFDLSDPTYQTLFYCTAIGMFKSTDGGNYWKLIFPPIIESEDDLAASMSFAQSPSDHNHMLIGTAGKGLYESTDGGASWNKMALSLDDTSTIFKIEMNNNSEVFMATSAGFYYSSDSGTNWEYRNSDLPHRYIWNMKYVDGVVYVTLPTFGTQGDVSSVMGGIFKSTDNGMTWIDITSNLPQMQSDGKFYFYWKFTVNPLNPKTIYIGTSVGYPDETLAAYEEWGIYKTIDGGKNWFKTDNNLVTGWMDETFFDERHALVLAISEADTNTVYWGRDWIAKTTDGGENWFQLYTNKVGNAWQGNGFELMMTECMEFSPSNQNTVYVGYDDMGPFRSDDGGNSFIPLDPTMDPFDGYDAAKVIKVDPDNGDVYIARYDGIGSAFTNGYTMGKIYFSNDNGATQSPISNGFPDGRPDMAIDFSAGSPGNRTIYTTSFSNGVYKSTNSGNSWSAINSGLGTDAAGAWVIRIDPNDNKTLYLGINNFGNGGGLYKSTDSGNNWNKISAFPDLDVLDIAFDKTNKIIYCSGTENYDWSVAGGLYKSTDGGNSWMQISGLPRIADIEIDNTNPDIIYILSQPWYSVWLPDTPVGVLKSTDGGITWNNVTGNLNHAFGLFIKLNPYNHNQIYVGTGGGGLWMAENLTEVRKEAFEIPINFSLHQNYPNPFNPETNIQFDVPQVSDVKLEIYNILGQRVSTLINKKLSPGRYVVKTNLSNFASGVYIARMETRNYSKSIKMLLIK